MHQFGDGLDIEFLHDVGAVNVHRLGADAQLHADDLARIAGHHEFHDFPLARGQRIEAAAQHVQLQVFLAISVP